MRSHAGMAKQTRGRRRPPLVRPLVGWLVRWLVGSYVTADLRQLRLEASRNLIEMQVEQMYLVQWDLLAAMLTCQAAC